MSHWLMGGNKAGVGLCGEELTYFGMTLFALEAALSRFSVSLALSDTLFRHFIEFIKAIR